MEQTPQPPNRQYLEIKPEDLAKVARNRLKRENALKIDPEQLFIAEFGKHYGWAGLLEGARRIDHRTTFVMAKASFIGAGAARSKKPVDTFKKSTKDIVKAMESDIKQ
jgi:predicted nicotinamide N-methyase